MKPGKLPPRMRSRKREMKGGTVHIYYFYDGRDESGKRKEIPLGKDLNEAKRKWAELERCEAPPETGQMRFIFDRYEKEVIPGKAPRTQRDNFAQLKFLRKVFDSAPIDAITPQHIAQYRDRRSAPTENNPKGAKVRANREIALFSHVFNMAREWGYTARENPVKGVRKNKEAPRDFYADDQIWAAVYAHACDELKDAMDLNYLTGQRPADVLKMQLTDIRDGALEVRQNKTAKKLCILLDDEQGNRTGLGKVIDRIMARGRKVMSFALVATPAGNRVTPAMLRTRFEQARTDAIVKAEENGDMALAERIKGFQFRDIRPKAASELGLEHASELLGHSDKKLTQRVYRRRGDTVKPTK